MKAESQKPNKSQKWGNTEGEKIKTYKGEEN